MEYLKLRCLVLAEVVCPSSNSSNKWQHLRKDQLVDPASAKALFEQAASSTKSFETDAFSSSQHELFNEDT